MVKVFTTIVLILLNVLGNSGREICEDHGIYYSYCEDGYHCCHNNTDCCKDIISLSTIAIVGIVIGAIVFLACVISLPIACYKMHNDDKKRVAQQPEPVQNQQIISVSQF